MEKRYKFFGGFLDSQERWLNQMAKKGYRLIRTGKLSYEFDKCKPNEYNYKVEFVAQLSYADSKDYKEFLEELGYKVFYKSVRINYSFLKLRWRPYGVGKGQITTNPGSFNKELFIVEKRNDGKSFELHSTNIDKRDYYKTLRNAWLSIAGLFLGLSVFKWVDEKILSVDIVVLAIVGVLLAIHTLGLQKRVLTYSSYAEVEE